MPINAKHSNTDLQIYQEYKPKSDKNIYYFMQNFLN